MSKSERSPLLRSGHASSPQLRYLFDQAVALDFPERDHFIQNLSTDNVRFRPILEAMLRVDTDGETTFLETLIKSAEPAAPIQPQKLLPGTQIADLVVVKEIGAGSGGTVYLATDLTLGRLCAIKVATNENANSEAQILARLSHPNIVPVFRAVDHPESNFKTICMRYVDGVNLGIIMDFLRTGLNWTMASLVEFLRTQSSGGETQDDKLLLDKNKIPLEKMTPLDFIYHILLSVADALHYAHSQKILHLDIKPSNILIDRLGNVCLLDFNVSLNKSDSASRPTGGTVAFMAPEHYQALFLSGTTNQIDEYCDVYSYGILIEALCDCLSASPPILRHLGAECASADRSKRPSGFTQILRDVQNISSATIVRRELHEFLASNWLMRWAAKHQLLAIYAASFVPNALASLVQIAYNRIHIMAELSSHQRSLFDLTLLPWNFFVFTAALLLLAFVYRGIALHAKSTPTAIERTNLRRKLFFNIVLTGFVILGGWLAGFVLFVSLLHTYAGPLSEAIIGHFAISFALAMILAMIFSLLPTAFINSIILLPQLVSNREFTSPLLKSQLNRVGKALVSLRLLAGIAPLAGASIAVYQGPGLGQSTTSYPYQLLVSSFILTSIFGFAYSSWLYDRWQEGYAILTRPHRR